MTDITQGQDAEVKPMPDVDTLFAKQDVDELFPANFKPTDQPVRNVSPIQDMLFANPGRAHARILDAFGYGFKQNWGAGQHEFSEADEALRKAGTYNDYAKGQHSVIKAANEAVMRPAVAALLAAKSTLSGAFSGGQAAVAQIGEEYGAPKLGRELAALPEAFPAGFHQAMGIPHAALPAEIEQAKSLGVIGAGEDGYFGTKPIVPETLEMQADAAKVAGVPEGHSEATPSPIVQAAPVAAQAPADIHSVARQIAPDTFREFDVLAQTKDTFRRWIGELREVRDQNARDSAPHAAEIADLEEKLKDATPRLAKKYQARLDPLVEERDAHVAEQTKADSADMAKVRQRLMQIDYRMRDLAPDVSKAYRDAETQMPKAETAEVPVETTEPAAIAAAPPADTLIDGVEKASQQAGKQAVAPAAPEPSETQTPEVAAKPASAAEEPKLPIAYAPSIVADVSQKLKAAGRPTEEADAAAQIVAAYWETRSTRFEGAKGTAAEMYAREAPDIVQGKEKPSKKTRELELAQKEQSAGLDLGKELNQTAYHGTPFDFDVFDTGKIGAGEGAQTYGHGLYFAEHEQTAKYYRDALTKPVPTMNGRVQATGSGKFNVVDDFGVQAGPFDTKEQALASMSKQAGNLYRVDIKPEPHEFLQWDKPLATQPELLKALQQVTPKPGWLARQVEGLKVIRHEMATNPESTGAQAYGALSRLLGGNRAATNALRDAGVPGIRYLDQGSRDAGEGTHNYVVFDPKDIEILDKNGKSVTRKEFELSQGVKGRIRLTDFPFLREGQHSVITLLKSADASTFIHEMGHEWLGRMLADAEDEKAPGELKTDADTVLKWLGVDSADAIKTRHHEKFARGFETYMMEGRAPSSALARVFAKFKGWLTTIYRTAAGLKAPISDDIRGVFDRLLAEKPENTVIAPERETPQTFADLHEADAERAIPSQAREVAGQITSERDTVAKRTLPEEDNARLEGVGSGAERLSARGQQPHGDGHAAEPAAGEGGNPAPSGTLGAGGTEAAQEGAVARASDPNLSFERAETRLTDKAGNIRIENLNSPEDVNEVIRQTARDNGDFGDVRGRISDGEVLNLADAMGIDSAYLDTRRLGEAWTAPQIVALRKLLIRTATGVRDAAMKAAEGVEADIIAYAEAVQRHRMVQERVSSVTAEAGRALRAFQSKFTEGMSEAKAVSAIVQDTTGKTLYQLQQEAKFTSKLKTPQQVSKVVHDTSEGKLKSAVLEYYINALISGPVTHMRYSVGNAVNALWTPLVEIPTAAAIGKIKQLAGFEAERVHLGEAMAQLYGLAKGSRDGLGAAIEAFNTGVSPALPGEHISPHFSQPNRAVPGVVGEALNIPSRSVAAIHSFFKSLRYEQNIQSLAYRTAANEGLKGEAFHQRIADLTRGPSEAMMASATSDALKELFMAPTDYHSAMGSLTRAINSNLLAKIIVPFMKIGSQITRNAFIERTPLGILDKSVRENLMSGGIGQDLQAAKITAGVSLMAGSVLMAAEGMITGDGPEDPAQRAIWLLNHRPNSLQIGDITLPYQGLGHLGMLMRFSADMHETAHGWNGEDGAKLAVSFFQGLTKSVLDENFMRGLKDMLDAVYHPQEYGSNYIKGFVTNWLPFSVGMSQTARQIDPYQREAHSIFQAAQAKIPWLSERLMPKRDRFGEPIPNGAPLPSYQSDPVVQAMESLHIGIGKLQKKIRGVELSDQQFDDYSRLAGRMTKMRLNALVNTPGFSVMPDQVKIETIHSIISSSRESARSMILMQAPEIIKQATDAKIAKLHPPPISP